MTPPDRPPDRSRAAAEVVELGQALFDAVLEATARPPAPDAEPFPQEELREAADAFFEAVRALLGLSGAVRHGHSNETTTLTSRKPSHDPSITQE